MRKLLILLVFLAALILAACSDAAPAQSETGSEDGAPQGRPVQVEGGAYRDISVAELDTMLKAKDFVFVNVHIPFEGDISNTDLSIPFDRIGQNLDQLPGDKNAKIVLYCRSDRMSRIAAEELVGLGYTNLWNLDGGFDAWENAGLPLEK